MKILLVEDEKKVSSFIRKGLEEEYHTVDVADDGKKGLALIESELYDIIITDLMLPLIDGITLTREIRKREITTPILILTVKDNVNDKVKGLDAGADDYLTKPFSFDELLARLRALTRRASQSSTTKLTCADLELDQITHSATRAGKSIFLTQKEYALLEFLLINKNTIVSRTRLIEHIYDYHFDTDSNIIEVYVNKLRSKIDLPGLIPLIHTIRGAGYLMKEE